MDVQIVDLSPVEKRLTAVIPWDLVARKLDMAFKALGNQVTMNGFRKGKVPRTVLEQRYGRHVRDEVQKELLQESFVAAVRNNNIEPVADPVVEEAALTPGEGFRFSARIEIRAPIEGIEAEGLAANRKKVDVAEAEVDRAMESRRKMHTEYRPVTERKVTASSDVVVISCVGKVGEIAVDKPDLNVDLGETAHEPLPGLVAALTGIPTDAKDHVIEMDLAADLPEAELAGKHASLKITVKDVREKVLPELDDEFAKDTGEAETLADLRAKVRGQLEKAAFDRANRDTRESLLKELVKRNPLPVAPALIERGIDSQIQRARMSLAMSGVDINKAGVDLTAMRDRLRDGATDEIRGQLLLEALADKEGLTVTDADVDAKVAELAAAQGKRANKVKGELLKDGSMDTLKWRIRQEKALDLVASRATITEVADNGGDVASSPSAEEEK
jgi:trigger factor